MIGKENFCLTASGTNEEIWKEISAQIGPTQVDTDAAEELMASDIAEYESWVASNWDVPLYKWLLWRSRIGTASYGNLPRNKIHDGKVGHCYAPCPYSTQSSDLRTRHLLGLSDTDTLPTKTDHTDSEGIVYYMKTSSKGVIWGFECTYPSCPYNIENGEAYFAS